MLQANEIQQRLSHIQQTIGQAEQACSTDESTPPAMRSCIEKLARESKQVNAVMQSNDQSRIIQCVDELESLSDEAKRVSRSEPTMPAHLETVVTQVHAELSQLKHQLH